MTGFDRDPGALERGAAAGRARRRARRPRGARAARPAAIARRSRTPSRRSLATSRAALERPALVFDVASVKARICRARAPRAGISSPRIRSPETRARGFALRRCRIVRGPHLGRRAGGDAVRAERTLTRGVDCGRRRARCRDRGRRPRSHRRAYVAPAAGARSRSLAPAWPTKSGRRAQRPRSADPECGRMLRLGALAAPRCGRRSSRQIARRSPARTSRRSPKGFERGG